jgi:hypothetical protein
MTPPAELTDILPLDWTPRADEWPWTATDGTLTYFAKRTYSGQWGLGINDDDGHWPTYTNYGGTVTDALEQLIRLVVEFRGRGGKLDRLAVLRLAMGART